MLPNTKNICDQSLLHLLSLYTKCWLKHTSTTCCYTCKLLQKFCITTLTSFTLFSTLTLTQIITHPTKNIQLNTHTEIYGKTILINLEFNTKGNTKVIPTPSVNTMQYKIPHENTIIIPIPITQVPW